MLVASLLAIVLLAIS
jgi:hypothetical protein